VELVTREKKLEHHQYLRRRWDGALIHVVENVVGEFDENGRLLSLKGYLFDNTARRLSEEALLKKDLELTRQVNKTEKLNAALSALLERRELELRQKEEDIQSVVDKLVLPHLYDLKATNLHEDQLLHLEVIEGNLKSITSSFARHLSTWKAKLTPSEIRVAELIRLGKSSKEIASLLRVSPHAVAFHRTNLRSKLGLANRSGNLASYLQHIG
jgi:DNA-binding CsgD family transcriptional regulator